MSSALWQNSQRSMFCLEWQNNRFIIVDVNPAMVDWLVVPTTELINRPIHEVLSSQIDQTPYYLKSSETGQAIIFEDCVHLRN
ncbi:MAG: hypothetical protein AAFY17_02030, partial [Cyanobacteria bacterium J06642_11]